MTILLIAATYVFTPIVVPGSSIQVAFGLNDSEQTMVTTADGVSGVYRRGTFTPLPPSDAGLATGFGINNDGVITGTITLADGSDQGFILSGSTYTTFSRPGFIYTAPRAIDNAGMVTGFSFNAVPTVGSRGFLYDPATGTFTDVTPSGSTFTLVQGSNVAGQVTGNSQGRGVTRYGFVWQGGSFTTFRVGTGYLNLIAMPEDKQWSWWGRVIFHVADVDVVYAKALAAGFAPSTTPQIGRAHV